MLYIRTKKIKLTFLLTQDNIFSQNIMSPNENVFLLRLIIIGTTR